MNGNVKQESNKTDAIILTLGIVLIMAVIAYLWTCVYMWIVK